MGAYRQTHFGRFGMAPPVKTDKRLPLPPATRPQQRKMKPAPNRNQDADKCGPITRKEVEQ